MKTSVLKFLILNGLFNEALCAIFGRNIYVSRQLTWSDAREYCKEHHTDFSSINNLEDDDSEKRDTWTGLYKEASDTWKWLNGTNALSILLEDEKHNYKCVVQTKTGLTAANCKKNFPFYCFQSSLMLVKESKTWKEAMEHCHSMDKELVNLPSESALAEVLQASKTAQTAQVWTALRYLGDSWLWVDGTPVEYLPWSQGEMPYCPAWTHHCGALSVVEQRLKSWDCVDQLNYICYQNSTLTHAAHNAASSMKVPVL